MRERLNKCIRVSAVILCVGCAYAAFCSLTGWGIPCPFHLITGLNCPGCGVSRMLLSLLRLDFAAAFRCNAGLFCLSPFLLALFAVWIVRYIRFGYRPHGRLLRAAELSMAALLILWGAVRNFIGM